VTAELCARQPCDGIAAARHSRRYAVLAICVTIFGIRIAVEECRVSCSEAMFSGRASSTEGS